MKIELNDSIREVDIGGQTFNCDVNDLESIIVLEEYEAKREAGDFDDTNLMLSESKKVLDTVFGQGTYQKLFGDTRSLAPLKVMVLDYYRDEMFKEQREKQEKEEKEASEYIRNQTELIKQMNTQMNYFNKAYGGMVSKRRASNKPRNR